MSISLIQQKGGGASATSFTIVWGSNTTTGNLIVVTVASNAATATEVTSITDSQSNTYTRADGANFASAITNEIWYAKNITGGTTPTITVNLASNLAGSGVANEYSGADTSAPFDKSHTGTGTGGTADSGSTVTTTVANEVIVGGIGGLATPTAGTGYGNLKTNATGTLVAALEDKLVSSTGTYNATFGGETSVWSCAVATFKEASASTLTVNVSDTATTSESTKFILESSISKSDTITTSESINQTLVDNIRTSDSSLVMDTANVLDANSSDFEGGVGSWSGGNGTIATTTDQAFSGTHSLQVTSTVSGNLSVNTAFPAAPGQVWNITAYGRAKTTTRAFFLFIQWYNSSSVFISQVLISPGNDSSTGWTLGTLTGVAPAGTASMIVFILWTSAVIGEVHYTDLVSLWPTDVFMNMVSFVNTTDTLTTSESTTLLIPELFISKSDSLTLTESQKVQLSSDINASDTITTSESINIALTNSVAVSDSSTLSESVTLLLQSNVAVSDTLTFTESKTLLIPTLFLSVSDSLTISESVQIQVGTNISVSDTATLSEVVNLVKTTLTLNVSDSITLSESINPTLTFNVHVEPGIQDIPGPRIV